MEFLKASDTINGGAGKVYVNVDGDYQEMFYVNSFEASIELEKEEFKALGSRVMQHKVVGWSGSGSMNVSYMTSKFRDLIFGPGKYTSTGILPEFTLVGTNEDVQSSVGTQRVRITGVLLNGVDVFRLDKEAGILDEDLEFTFTGVELEDKFSAPA